MLGVNLSGALLRRATFRSRINNISCSKSNNKKKSKRSKRIWMKPWMIKRNDKNAWVNIFSELLLDDKFWQYLQVNATSYIDFYTLITYTSYITYTYNYTTCIDYFITILVFTIHYSTRTFFNFTSNFFSILSN